jgi:cardiolipin synthase
MSAADRPDWATIPNLVTLVRFVLLLPVCLRLSDGPDTLGVVLLLVWASTDWIDGLLARALDQTSRTGQIIDPIADRLGLAAIVLTLALAGLLPWTALALIVIIDVAMAVLATGAALGGRISVSWLGKARTFVLMTSASALVPAAQVLVWVGAALHTVSGLDYILRARRAPAAAPAQGAPPSPR